MKPITEFLVNNHVKNVTPTLEKIKNNPITSVSELRDGVFVKIHSKGSDVWQWIGKFKEIKKSSAWFYYLVDMEEKNSDLGFEGSCNTYQEFEYKDGDLPYENIIPLTELDMQVLAACEENEELQQIAERSFKEEIPTRLQMKKGPNNTYTIVKK